MRSVVSDRDTAKQIEKDHLVPFTDKEMSEISGFLLENHIPSSSTRQSKHVEAIKDQPTVYVARRAETHQREQTKETKETKPIETKSPVSSKKKGSRWTSREEDELIAAFRRGDSPKRVAETFGRTVNALRIRAVRLGLIGEKWEWK